MSAKEMISHRGKKKKKDWTIQPKFLKISMTTTISTI